MNAQCKQGLTLGMGVMARKIMRWPFKECMAFGVQL